MNKQNPFKEFLLSTTSLPPIGLHFGESIKDIIEQSQTTQSKSKFDINQRFPDISIIMESQDTWEKKPTQAEIEQISGKIFFYLGKDPWLTNEWFLSTPKENISKFTLRRMIKGWWITPENFEALQFLYHKSIQTEYLNHPDILHKIETVVKTKIITEPWVVDLFPKIDDFISCIKLRMLQVVSVSHSRETLGWDVQQFIESFLEPIIPSRSIGNLIDQMVVLLEQKYPDLSHD